jgi:hypothetical protein
MHGTPPPSLVYDIGIQTIVVIPVSMHLRLPPGNRIFLEKLTVAHLVKKFLAFYVTGRFNTPIVSDEFSQKTFTLFLQDPF